MTIGEMAEVKGNAEQIFRYTGQPQNKDQERTIITVANLLNTTFTQVQDMIREGSLPVETALAIKLGAYDLNWKPFRDHFHDDPHPYAVAYWMANHVFGKRILTTGMRVTRLEQAVMEMSKRLQTLEQRQG